MSVAMQVLIDFYFFFGFYFGITVDRNRRRKKTKSDESFVFLSAMDLENGNFFLPPTKVPRSYYRSARPNNSNRINRCRKFPTANIRQEMSKSSLGFVAFYCPFICSFNREPPLCRNNPPTCSIPPPPYTHKLGQGGNLSKMASVTPLPDSISSSTPPFANTPLSSASPPLPSTP